MDCVELWTGVHSTQETEIGANFIGSADILSMSVSASVSGSVIEPYFIV